MNSKKNTLSLPSGPLEGLGAPRRKFNNRNDNAANTAGIKRKPARTVHREAVKPVIVPQELLELLVLHGKRNSLQNRIRMAVTNCIHQSPGGDAFTLADHWEALGRWASTLRGRKEIEGTTDRHQAWEHIQRLRYALDRAANDPMLQNKTRYKINQYLQAALMAWDIALAKHFASHPEDLMTPDEFAGMEAAPTPQSVREINIFKRPPSKPQPAPQPEA